MPLEDIPAFLRIPQNERREAWEKFRAERKPLPPEAPPVLRRIPTLPGVTDADDS